MERTIALLETIEDGVLHIRSQLAELRYEEALSMLQDILEGVNSIQNAIHPIVSKLEINLIFVLYDIIIKRINQIVNEYEQGNHNHLESYVEKEFIPAIIEWKREIEKGLRMYIVS